MRGIPLFQVRKNESFWKCTLPLKSRKLCPEYQLALFDACCWTPTASSRPCCCCSSKVRRGPLRTTRFLRGFSSATLVHYHFCQPSLLCKQTLILKEAPPPLLHPSPFRSECWRELWEFSYNMLHMTARQSRRSSTNVLACSPSCQPGQMQLYSTLNRHLWNTVLDHEEAVGDMKSIFMLSKMHRRPRSGCCICVRRIGTSVRCAPSASDGSGNSLSFLWLRENGVVVSFVCDNHSFIVMLLNEVCDATAVRLSLTVSPWSLRIIK